MNFDLNKSFDDGYIVSVYDLEKDYEEIHNIKNKIEKKKVNSNINFIKKEFYLLKNDIKKNDFKKFIK